MPRKPDDSDILELLRTVHSSDARLREEWFDLALGAVETTAHEAYTSLKHLAQGAPVHPQASQSLLPDHQNEPPPTKPPRRPMRSPLESAPGPAQTAPAKPRAPTPFESEPTQVDYRRPDEEPTRVMAAPPAARGIKADASPRRGRGRRDESDVVAAALAPRENASEAAPSNRPKRENPDRHAQPVVQTGQGADFNDPGATKTHIIRPKSCGRG